jgi:hypothetical protein
MGSWFGTTKIISDDWFALLGVAMVVLSLMFGLEFYFVVLGFGFAGYWVYQIVKEVRVSFLVLRPRTAD